MNKLINYHSYEQQYIKDITKNIHLFDTDIALIIENYIYNKELKYCPETNNLLLEKSTKYGLVEGKCQFWSIGGIYTTIQYYKNNKKHGTFTSYKNNIKFREFNYLNDLQHGLQLSCDTRNGNKLTEIYYENGKQNGKHISYWPNNIISIECYYKDDYLHGIRKSYNNIGKLMSIEHYNNGKLIK